jgi:hypothetical protein
VSPITVYSRPTEPASTSPVFTPTRRAKLTPCVSTSPSLISAIAACMPSAARIARSASSSWATGAPKIAITLSPMYLSTRPP